MKILITSSCPIEPADQGVRTHLRWIIESLSQRHDVAVIGFYTSEPERAGWSKASHEMGFRIAGLVPLASGLELLTGRWQALMGGLPFGTARYCHRKYRELAEHSIREETPDWIIFGQYNTVVPVSDPRVRCALLPLDSYELYYLRLAARLEAPWARLRSRYLAGGFARLEQSWKDQFDRILPVAEPDARRIATHAGDEGISVLPVALPEMPAARARTGGRVAVLGAFGMPVVDQGVQKFLDGWRAQPVADTELVVWGRGATARVQRQAAAAGAQYVAWVDDYFAFLDQFDIVVYPQSAAAGLQTKVQQAMALGITVVAHPEILSALGVQPGRGALAAITGDEFREAVRTLRQEPERQGRMGLAAAAIMRRNYSAESLSCRLESLLESSLPANTRAA